jgi:hypothetical protein
MAAASDSSAGMSLRRRNHISPAIPANTRTATMTTPRIAPTMPSVYCPGRDRQELTPLENRGLTYLAHPEPQGGSAILSIANETSATPKPITPARSHLRPLARSPNR